MSNDTDLDIVQEQESVLAQERQKMEERRRNERRGWYITWTTVVSILLVTIFVTVALSAGDEPADFAAGEAKRFRMVMTFELKAPGQEVFQLRAEGFIEESNGLAHMKMSFEDPRTGKNLSFEFIAVGEDIESAEIYLKINEFFQRPAGAPDEAEWILVDETDPMFASATQAQGIGSSTGNDIHPFGFLENLGVDVKTKELRTERLRGVETTVTRLTVDTEEYFTAIGQDQIAGAASVIGKTVSFDVWLDDEGTLHKMLFAKTLQGATFKMTMEIFPGEGPQTGEIEIPDASLVFDSRGTPIQTGSSIPQPSGTTYPQEQTTSTPTARASAAPAPEARPSEASTTFRCTGQQIGGEEKPVDC